MKIKSMEFKRLHNVKDLYEFEELEKTKIYIEGKFRGRRFAIGKNRLCDPVAYVELFPDEVEYYKAQLGPNDGIDVLYDVIGDSVHGGLSYSGKAYWLDENERDDTIYIGWDYGHADDYNPRNEKNGYYLDYSDGTEVEVYRWSIAEIMMEIAIQINLLDDSYFWNDIQ